MSEKRSRIPGVGKTFDAVGAAGEQNERHIYVNVNANAKRRLFEHSHTRHTVWLENDISDILQRNVGGQRGVKTQAVNDALRQFIQNREWK